MDVMQTFAQVAVAALSVIGFYALIHGIFDPLLCPRQIRSAVVVRSMQDAADLDILLCEARRAPCRGKSRGVLLAVSAELLDGRMGEGYRLNQEYASLAERHGAEVCIFDPPNAPNP